MSTDAQLLQAFRSGDETAFATVAERYQTAIQAACQRQAPSGEVDDCVQAVFLVLARRPAAAAAAPVLLAWLHQVAVFVCRDARRAAARRRRIVTSVPPEPAPGNTPEHEVLERLDAALLGLEARQRAAVLLHASGDANDVIAQSLGVSTANASKLVQRGLATLRERLARSGVPVGASMLLALMSTQTASAATTPPLTLHALNHASTNASLLAKGTIMHLTMTTMSTWMIAAGLATALGVGALVASDAFSQPPNSPRPMVTALAAPADVPVPVPVLTGWEKDLEEQLQKRLTFDFQDVSLTDAVKYLRTTTKITFIIHPNALKMIRESGTVLTADNASVVVRKDSDSPIVVKADKVALSHENLITFKANDMSLRAVLNHLCAMTRLRYQIRDQAIFFSLPEKQDQELLEETERQLAQSVGFARDAAWGKQILNQLNQSVTLNLQDTELKDIVDFLRKTTSCNFVLDPLVPANAPPVVLEVENMKLGFVLNHLMRQHGLRYQLRDEAIYIAPLDLSQRDIPAITIKVTDLRAAEAAQWLSTMAHVPISLDPALVDTRVSFHFTDTEFAKVLEFLGAVLRAEVTPLPKTGGYHLTPSSTSAERTVPASATTPGAPNTPVPPPGSVP